MIDQSDPDPKLEFGQLGAQRFLGFAAFAHLAHDRRNPDYLVGLVPQERHTEFDRQPMSVAVQEAGTLNSLSP